ncbi:MAG: PLP-dependent aminotransferase family protein [Vulcanimicrobiaceae bacterium]
MARTELPIVALDRSSEVPLGRQLHATLARAILDGRLKAGARLPSTRRLSADLGVSRNTVNFAYDQLSAEGYIESAVGAAGSRVTSSLPAAVSRAGLEPEAARTVGESRKPGLSRRGAAFSEAAAVTDAIELRAPGFGSPALDEFPMKLWKRLMTQTAARMPSLELGYGKPAGYFPLRELIAEHLGRTRGLNASPKQIIVVAGTQQALDLAARMLLDAGDRVLFEDPGYPGARTALLGSGAILHPVPVDAEGMNPNALPFSQRRARAAYLTPAHQFPLGTTMSLARRLALLEWADSCNAWIFEDDYDGEFRYAGNPLSALASIDTSERTVYIGTFSKVMFPALRIGFMVLPRDVAGRMVSARGYLDRQSPLFDQVALAAFMEQGHFVRHIRRMRAVYAERRATLVQALAEYGADLFHVDAPETGMRVIAWLRDDLDDKRIADAVDNRGLTVVPLSAYYLEAPPRPALLIGFATVRLGAIEPDVRRIASAVREALARARC